MRAPCSLLAAAATVLAMYPVAVAAQPGDLPVDLPDGPAKPGFDLTRFSSAGNGRFETFHVKDTQALEEALKAGQVVGDTRVLVMETAAGRLALLTDQMAYHHLAQGHAGGKDWMATF